MVEKHSRHAIKQRQIKQNPTPPKKIKRGINTRPPLPIIFVLCSKHIILL